jgi:hypothetical protein
MAKLADHIWGMKTIFPAPVAYQDTPHSVALSQIGAQRDWMQWSLDRLGAAGDLPFTFARHPRSKPAR